MERIEKTDGKGRKYQYLRDENGLEILLGPPEGLVDSLDLPEPFATTLHNILFSRGIYNSRSFSRDPKAIVGALQEALMLDVQKLTEAFFRYEQEVPQ